jgi:hypothetical protein
VLCYVIHRLIDLLHRYPRGHAARQITSDLLPHMISWESDALRGEDHMRGSGLPNTAAERGVEGEHFGAPH